MPDTDPFGSVTLEPSEPVVAGSYGTWTITYTVGALGLDDGGLFKLAMHQTSDRGIPQFDDPTADNYATVTTDGDATVTAHFDSDGHIRSYRFAVVCKVTDGSLAPGETLTLTLGDRSGGSLGQRAQSFSESDVRFIALVDPHKSGDTVELDDTLDYDVVPGPARNLAATLPATIDPNEDATLSVRAEDRWGNLASTYSGTVSIESDKMATPGSLTIEHGLGHTTVTPERQGIHRITVHSDNLDTDTTTNPCRCRDTQMKLYWGDIHGQTIETVGHRTIDEYFTHLRDVAFLDYGAHAGNDFQITDEFWEHHKQLITETNDPGSFVTFLCSEWSATTPLGGDHNIYFKDETAAELTRSSKWLVTDNRDEKTDGTRPVAALYDHFTGRDDVLIIPHQGGRPSTLDVIDPALTPFIEITSVWGVFEWFADEAMAMDHRVGFVGGSDDHCGRPGTAPPDNLAKHNVSGGLMATIAPTLDRESLWDAWINRHVYATTGARILLDVTVADAPMGAEVTTSGPVEIETTVNGTAPIAGIDLIRGTEVIATDVFDAGADNLEIAFQGQRHPPRSRDKVIDWNGGVTLDRGIITDAAAFGFDRPDDGVIEHTEQLVRWKAGTTGNRQGVRLGLDAPDDATLSVSTKPATASISLDDPEPVEVPAAGVDAALTIRRVGTPTALDVTTSFSDDPEPGTYPYYVRVRQVDGNRAWSSPTFVAVEH